jgi:hypothetical protein
MAGFGQDTQRVLEAGKEPWRHRGRVPQFVEPSGKHEEAADKVATVDRGDVARGERRKRVNVVPVEQVTTVPFEAAERVERMADAADELRDRAPAKVDEDDRTRWRAAAAKRCAGRPPESSSTLVAHTNTTTLNSRERNIIKFRALRHSQP